MKDISKYTKNLKKWLDFYKLCKSRLHHLSTRIISCIKQKKSRNSKNFFGEFAQIQKVNFFEWVIFQKNILRKSFLFLIIDRYLLKSFFKIFLSVFVVLVLVIVGRLFVRLLQYVVDGRFDVNMIFELLFLSTSKSIILLLPFAIMIGLVISLSKLYRDSEISALKASGKFKEVFTKLFYTISIPSFFIIFILSMFISPHVITNIQKTKIEAAATSEIGLTSPGKFIQMKDKNWIIFVEDIEDDISKRIFIKSSENNKISIETAEEGDEFLEDGIRRLVLKNGQRYTGTPGTGNFQVMKYDIHEVKLLNTTPDFSVNYRMKDLYDLISDKNAALASAEIQWRLFAPISVIILVLFAFVLGDVAPRQNKYSNILYAIIIYFIYSNLIIVSINGIQKNTLFFSIFGTWWVHALAILICLILFKNNKNQILNFNYIKNRIENLKHKL